MCFNIHIEYPKKLIAEKNITCYKRVVRLKDEIVCNIHHLEVMRIDTSKLRKSILLSPYRYQQYKTRVLYRSRLVDNKCNGCIHEGLHSHSSLRQAEIKREDHYEKIIRCVIPKGAEYYYNPEEKEYVSNQLRTIKLVR